MKIYIDENISKYIALGFQQLQQPYNKRVNVEIEISSIVNEFGRGVPDEEWIPIIGKQQACFVTQDRSIRRTRTQWQLCEEHKVGAFFVRMGSRRKGLEYWQQVEFLIKKWPEIIRLALKTERPFAFEITARKISRL
ncbi:MAG: hypothetical protein AAF433_19860 [Bacteroidota bacterium]